MLQAPTPIDDANQERRQQLKNEGRETEIQPLRKEILRRQAETTIP